MLGEKELNEYMKTEEVKEEKTTDIKALFESMNNNLALMVEAFGELGRYMNKDDGDKVEEVEEVKETETETEEEKEV